MGTIVLNLLTLLAREENFSVANFLVALESHVVSCLFYSHGAHFQLSLMWTALTCAVGLPEVAHLLAGFDRHQKFCAHLPCETETMLYYTHFISPGLQR